MINARELRSIPLFGAIPDDEAAELAGRMGDVHLREGEWLLHEGDQPSFFLLLEGSVEVRKRVHTVDQRIAVYRTGEYFGELPLLLGSPAIASLRALETCRLAQLEPNDFAELFSSCEHFASELTRTMTQRLARLRALPQQAPPPSATIVGHPFDIACHHLRDFLTRNQIPFRSLDPTRPVAGSATPMARPGDEFPVVILPDGERLVTPTLRELAQRMGLQTRPKEQAYDVAIIGAGPAGLAAAVYGASEGLCTVLIEREAPGGQAGTSSRIENYLGFPTGVSGEELGRRAMDQARRFGAEMVVAREVTGLAVDHANGRRAVVLDGGERVEARTLILANGVSWRRLDVPGAEALVGRGVYYGAARTEARSCQGLHVFLVGGGNSAGQAAMFFANHASRVTLMVRRDSLAATMSWYLIEQLRTKSNIEVRTRCRIVQMIGENRLESIVVENRATGELSTEPAGAVFVFIGADAETAWLPADLIRDRKGYVCTGRDVIDLVAQDMGSWPLPRDPYLLETSVPGVFAAGDVRHGSIKRVASGVGEGSMAIAFVHQFLAD
jgi:thioredoxin reductase (NADPH)